MASSRIAAQTPSICVQFVGDEIESYDNQPGITVRGDDGGSSSSSHHQPFGRASPQSEATASDDPAFIALLAIHADCSGVEFDNGRSKA